MLIRKLAISLIMIFSTAICAEGKQPLDLDDPKPLILQPGYHLKDGYSDESTSDAFNNPESSGDAFTDHCSTLLDKAAKLKRQKKPQQHWAALERHKYECQANFNRPAEKAH